MGHSFIPPPPSEGHACLSVGPVPTPRAGVGLQTLCGMAGGRCAAPCHGDRAQGAPGVPGYQAAWGDGEGPAKPPSWLGSTGGWCRLVLSPQGGQRAAGTEGLLRGQQLVPAAQPQQQQPCAAPCPATSAAAPASPGAGSSRLGVQRGSSPALLALPWGSECCGVMRGCGAGGANEVGGEQGCPAAAWREWALHHCSVDSGLKGLQARGKHSPARDAE